MTTTRRLTCEDLLRFNNVNLDVLTETLPSPILSGVLGQVAWYFAVQESGSGDIMGYVMGKVEGSWKRLAWACYSADCGSRI